MSVIERIKAQAKNNVKHIVLAEGSEPGPYRQPRRLWQRVWRRLRWSAIRKKSRR